MRPLLEPFEGEPLATMRRTEAVAQAEMLSEDLGLRDAMPALESLIDAAYEGRDIRPAALVYTEAVRLAAARNTRITVEVAAEMAARQAPPPKPKPDEVPDPEQSPAATRRKLGLPRKAEPDNFVGEYLIHDIFRDLRGIE